MPEPQAKRTVSPPLVLLAVWAVALLAYPAWLLGVMVASPSTKLCVEYISHVVLHGMLHLPVALIALALWLVAIGAGMALLRRAGFGDLTVGEQAIFGGALGMGILSLGTFLAGTVSGRPPWLQTALVVALVGALAAVGFRDALRLLGASKQWADEWSRRRRLSSVFIIVLGLGIVAFALTRANVPVAHDYDSLLYHFGGPAQWWRAGQITFLRDLVYTNFPQNVEMLYLLTTTLCGGPVLGAVVGLQVGIGFTLLTAAAIAACGRRLASETAGLAGAAIFLTTPMLGELATLNSYVVELPLTAYTFLALFAFLLLRRAAGRGARLRLAILCGAMAGLAIGCKYPAVLFALAPILGFIVCGGIFRLETLRRSLAEAVVVGGVAVAVASPWLVRNAVNTGNPTYPLLYHTFGSRNWTPEQDAKFAKAHRAADVRLIELGRPFYTFAIWRDQPGEPTEPPWRVPASPILFLFALIPVAMAERRSARAVVVFAIFFLALAHARRFWPEEHRLDLLLSASVLALITMPAFLIPRRDLVFLPLHFVLCFIAWYTLTHRIDRFLDPATPAIAVLSGIGVAMLARGWPRRVANGIVVGGLAYTLAVVLLVHTGPTALGLDWPTGKFLALFTRGSTYSQQAMDFINTELPPDAKVLFVGEGRTFYCERRAVAATVFDRHPIDRIIDDALDRSHVPPVPEGTHHGSGLLAAARPEAEPPPKAPLRLSAGVLRRIRDGLSEQGVTHIYVSWAERKRLGDSYAYRFDGEQRDGYSATITKPLFADLEARGHLSRLWPPRSPDAPPGPPPFVVYELR